MTIYTGRGDAGWTELRGGARISKASPRIESYGTIDEVNALIGRVRPTDHDDVDDDLQAVQNDLHVIQAELAAPEADASDPRITTEDIERLEGWIDRYEAELDPLQHFILPGGGECGSRLHHARTVCRRSERRITDLNQAEPVRDEVVVYVNRLSDLLFVLARAVNARECVSEESPTY